MVLRLEQFNRVCLFAFSDRLRSQIRSPRGQQPPEVIDPSALGDPHGPLLRRHLDLDRALQVPPHSIPRRHPFLRDDDLIPRLQDAPPFFARTGLRSAQPSPVEVDENQAVEAEEGFGQGEREGRVQVGGGAVRGPGRGGRGRDELECGMREGSDDDVQVTRGGAVGLYTQSGFEPS